MNSELEHAANKHNQAQLNLEETITALVKELYRLQGRAWYESVGSELESMIKGEG